MLEKIQDNSVVRLTDGRDGTVLAALEAPGKPLAYLVELGESPEERMATVLHSEIAAVVWEQR